MVKTIVVEDRIIGEGQPVFIIAEAGINHDGKFEQAIELIDIAVEAGCDAVKFQLFKAKEMYVSNPGQYKTANGTMELIYDLVKAMELPVEWLPKLIKYCKERHILFLSTTCDNSSTQILEQLGVKAFKIASYDITNLPLLSFTARTKKPIIFSTAGSKLAEVEEAYHSILAENNNQIVIMHCVAQYPTPAEENNLNIITTYNYAFPNAIIGFSDHSLHPIEAPTAAVALGAKVIEKHFTIDKTLPGADHSFALEPAELKQMVQSIRETEKKITAGEHITIPSILLGSSERKLHAGEEYVQRFAYRCITAIKDIKKGEILSSDNIAVLRPGEQARGLEPKYYTLLLEKKAAATNDIKINSSLQWDDILAGPKISIIIRAFNSAEFIQKALASVINQSFSQWEIIIVDDGSNDNLVETIQKFLTNSKISLVKQKNLGAIKAANLGAAKARGKHILFLDADDILEERALENLHRAVQDRDYSYGDYYEERDGDKTLISTATNIFNCTLGGILFSRDLFLKLGSLSEELLFPEYDLLIKLERDYCGIHVPGAVFTYVRHNRSMTAQLDYEHKAKKQLQEYYPHFDIKRIRNYEKLQQPIFDEKGMTQWHWIVKHHHNLELGENTEIGSFVLIDAYRGVVIEDNVKIGFGAVILSYSSIDQKSGLVTLKKGCSIGANSVIMPGVTISENSIVGAQSLVTKNIPPGEIWFGSPAKFHKKI